MNCSICGKKVVLEPSASERARRYGGKASDYTALFTYHAQCMIDKRNADVMELIKRKQEIKQ